MPDLNTGAKRWAVTCIYLFLRNIFSLYRLPTRPHGLSGCFQGEPKPSARRQLQRGRQEFLEHHHARSETGPAVCPNGSDPLRLQCRPLRRLRCKLLGIITVGGKDALMWTSHI